MDIHSTGIYYLTKTQILILLKKSSLDKIRDENLCEEEQKFLTTISSNQNDEE